MIKVLLMLGWKSENKWSTGHKHFITNLATGVRTRFSPCDVRVRLKQTTCTVCPGAVVHLMSQLCSPIRQLIFLHHVSERLLILSGVFFLRVSLCCWTLQLLSVCWILAKMAESKASFRFFWVSAEHSAKPTAPISWARRWPSSVLTGRSWFCARWINTCTSSLRSSWVPTRTKGALGQSWRISGTHLLTRLRKEQGRTTL